MTKFLEFLQGFFQGKQSATRLCLIYSTFLLFGTWSYTIIANKPNPITEDIVYAYGLIVGGKAVGKYFEVKPKTPTDPTDSTTTTTK